MLARAPGRVPCEARRLVVHESAEIADDVSNRGLMTAPREERRYVSSG